MIDVVIPAFYPNKRLLDILDMLKRQTMPPRAVHIINTEEAGLSRLLSKEGTDQRALEARYAGIGLEIIHIAREDFDHGGTRNQGARRAAGADFVLMMTQDALPADEKLLQNLTAPFAADDRLAACYARQLANPDASAAEQYSRSFNYPDVSRTKSQADFAELGIKTYFCSNVCAVYRRDVLEKLGYFPEHMIFNEDMVFAGRAMQAGYHIRYEAGARVYHSHNYGPGAQFHRNFDLGVSQADHPEIFAASSSEGEGVRYVKAVVAHLQKTKAAGEIPGFVICCAARLIGYKLGKSYQKLPRGLCRSFSSNKSYWG